MSLQDLVRLGDVVNLKRGYDLPTSSRIDGPYPVISSSGPTGLHSEFKVHPPGVVIGRYGTLGEVFFVETPFWPLNTTLYVEDFRGNDERWVAALLESLHLEQLAASSAVPGINRNHLHLLEVPQPCIEDQVLIGRCLRLFADLIENNRRRIELLEETARLLYWEWFVGFRYPGHQDVSMIESELGLIPERWEIRTLEEIVETVTETYDPQNIPSGSAVLSLGDIQNHSMVIRDWECPEIAGSRKTKFKRGDLLFAKLDPGSHKAASSPIDGFCSTDIIVLRTLREEYAGIGLGLVSSNHFVAVAAKAQNGTTHQRVPVKFLLEYKIALPPLEILNEFNQQFSSMVDTCNALVNENKVLSDIRDLLLPRLVSGELDVSDLELTG